LIKSITRIDGLKTTFLISAKSSLVNLRECLFSYYCYEICGSLISDLIDGSTDSNYINLDDRFLSMFSIDLCYSFYFTMNFSPIDGNMTND
jgi:hypothetical protein